MKDYFKKWWDDVISEIKSYPANYILLATILILALFVRVYRTEDLLGFYYDQGRDAKVIWRLWHEGRPFLIGPVTGLQGIFLGPLYYYLIAPFYLIGGGSPVTPTIFLAFLSTIAVFILYYLGWKFESRVTGFIAATIGAFSLELVKAGRWLANPTPVLLISMLLLWSMWRIVNKNSKSKWEWVSIAVLIGISLQFEAASAVYYLPMILVFAIWQRKKLPSRKVFLISSLIFLTTLLPQVVFNFRHENILFNNFKRMLLEEKSFTFTFWEVLRVRLEFFWSVLSSKILPNWHIFAGIFSLITLGAIVIEKKSEKLRNAILLILIFLVIPMLGFIAFQGNFGNIFDYYMTGYYLPMILLFSLGLGILWKSNAGKAVVILFFVLFFMRNGSLVRYYLIAGVDGPEHITLGNELQAVEWVFENTNNRGEFNVDVYVPPVIPHSYDYLFLWQATKRCGDSLCQMNKDEQVPLLYTLYEVDPPHPWRLEAWLERQDGIGVVEEEHKFGGITVQRRRRL
jgi:4-amino-4-deoxy-L-arabinose transferase-like glycosyltransferase